MGTQPSIGRRFKAWWEGYELPVEPAPDAEDEEPDRSGASARGGKDEGPDGGASDETDAQPSTLRVFRERFKAWWEGYEYGAVPAEDEDSGSEKAAGDKGAGPSFEPKARGEAWTPGRIKVVERLWGAGFVSPGGPEHTLQLVKPIVLTPKMTFLHLGAGLGGPARAISEAYGVWVTGLEASEALAAVGMEEATMAGMARKAPVFPYDPESVELRGRGFDCILATEAFFTVVNKKRLFKTIARSLKKGGQFLFTDYVLAEPGQSGPKIEGWMAREPVRPEPWSGKEMREHLEAEKLAVRIVEDMSAEMCRLVLQGWSEALANLKPGHIGPDLADALLAEIEIWARRIEVMESGEVRFCRFHALKA